MKLLGHECGFYSVHLRRTLISLDILSISLDCNLCTLDYSWNRNVVLRFDYKKYQNHLVIIFGRNPNLWISTSYFFWDCRYTRNNTLLYFRCGFWNKNSPCCKDGWCPVIKHLYLFPLNYPRYHWSHLGDRNHLPEVSQVNVNKKNWFIDDQIPLTHNL